MKILVTGANGFIGSNLVPELGRRGCEVWGCDLKHSEKKNYLRADVANYRQLERIFESHHVKNQAGFQINIRPSHEDKFFLLSNSNIFNENFIF